MARKIGELFFELRSSTELLSRDLKEGERQLGKFADFVKANPVLAVTGLAAAFVGVAFQAAQAAAKIETSFRQTTNLLGATRDEAIALRNDLQELSAESGKSQDQLVGVFRTIAANGPNGAKNVRAIADAALALTEALGGDLTANAAALDSITDIFGIDPSGAREVAAILTEISEGRVPLDDLVATLGKIAPSAQEIGLSFETSASALTRFLDTGLSVKQSAARFKELADSGAAGRAELEKIATGAISVADAMAKLDTKQKAVRESAESQYEILKNQLNIEWIKFGNVALPPVNKALQLLVTLLDDTQTKAQRTKIAMETLFDVGPDTIEQIRAGFDSIFGRRGPSRIDPPTVTAPARPSAPTAVVDSVTEQIGKRYAQIVSATKELERLSSSQLRDNQQKLQAIVNDAGANDSQRIAAKKLLEDVSRALEGAITKESALQDKLRALGASVKDLNAELRGDNDGSAQAKLRAKIAAYEALGVPITKLRAELAALNQTAFTAAGTPSGDAAVQRISAINAKYGETLRALDALQVAAENFDRREGSKQQVEDIEAWTTAMQKSLATTLELIDAARLREDEQRRTRQALADELKAVEQGTEAYKAYQREKFATDAVAAAQQQNRGNPNAPPVDVAQVRRDALEVYDTTQRINTAVRQLQQDVGGGVLSAFAGVATQATQIATSLGEGGRNLARYAGLLGPLLSGLNLLNTGLQQRDANGALVKGANGASQSVSVFSALSGRNGKDSQAQALAGALSVVGAVATVADALDVFGVRAKERARQMAEAAVAFDRALKEFAASANPQTGASEQIRQARLQAAELAKQAVEASGGRYTPSTADISVAALREQQAGLLAGAEALRKLGTSASRKLADELGKIAGRFGELADSLVAVEAAARAQVKRNLEDLGVRMLAANGDAEGAAALRDRLEAQRALDAALRDTTTEGREYAEALRIVQEAEAKAAEAARARAKADEAFADASRAFNARAKLFNLEGIEYLKGLVELQTSRFSELQGLLDGIDVSSAAGLEALKERVRAIFATLAPDGITASEQALIDALLAIVEAAENSATKIVSAAEQISEAFATVDEQNAILGGDAQTQLSRSLAAARTTEQRQVDARGGTNTAFLDVLNSADLSSSAGRNALQQRLRDFYESIAADGIDAAEAPIVGVIRRLLGDLGTVLNEDAAALTAIADQATADAETARTRAEQAANARTTVLGLSAGDAFQEQLTLLGPAFTALFGALDADSLASVAAAEDALSALLTEVLGLSDAEIATRFGLTRDEVINGILSINGSLGSMGTALKDAARATADFTASVASDFLRATGQNQAADIAEQQAKNAKRRAEAVALGLSPEILRQIDVIGAQAIADINKRYADALVTASSASGGAAATSSASSASAAASASARRTTTLVQDVGGLSEVTAQSLAGLLREGVLYQAESAQRLRDVVALLQGGLPNPPQALLRSVSGAPTATLGSTGGLVIQSLTVHIGQVAPGGLSPLEAATLTAQETARQLYRLASAETRFLGSAVA